MEYRSIHYWQYEPDVQEATILEEAIAFNDSIKSETFLTDVADFIGAHTGAKFVLIAILSDDLKKAQSFAFLKDRVILPNMTYALCGTPCDQVVTQRFCYYPLNVTQIFPDDEELKNQHIESYLGSMLLSHKNEPLGLIALMDEKPLANVAFSEHLILVLSPAIEEELTKLKEESLQTIGL
ncbi:hypothetical protein WG947_01185 [Pontibacter sp. H259]|uniref:hypothetical protein n=1 Tax=Pontibacter sp. H259 TaxID=3133421 RepID=UPI0030C46D1C